MTAVYYSNVINMYRFMRVENKTAHRQKGAGEMFPSLSACTSGIRTHARLDAQSPRKTQADVSGTYKPSTQETDKRSRGKLARSPARIGGFQIKTEIPSQYIKWRVVEEDP